MKKLILAVTMLCGAVSLFAAPPAGWTDDYDAALKTAAREHKYVYVLFTGSDWCSWCIRLRNDVLNKPEFKTFAQKHLVLVYCDFPEKNPLPQAQLAKQVKLNRQLQAGGGVPSAVVVDSSGKVVGRIGGYAPLQSYMTQLESFVK